MTIISKSELSKLYRSDEITVVWNNYQHLAVILHPSKGLISPNQYRTIGNGKPCPFCGKKMKHGEEFKTTSQLVAIKRGYEYINDRGQKKINQINSSFFHPNYVTIDHKINKARCPEKMFDFDNLQLICWQCNQAKSDDNAYELRHTYEHLCDLVNETALRYPLL
jgi:hypothetical protein